MVVGNGLFRVTSKLKNLKQKMRVWSKECFGDIFTEKQRLEEGLAKLNLEVLKEGMNNDRFLEEKHLLHDWEEILAREEIFWRQKSRDTWLKDGDWNIKYFHNSTRARKEANGIFVLEGGNGRPIVGHEAIAAEVVAFFRNILNN